MGGNGRDKMTKQELIAKADADMKKANADWDKAKADKEKAWALPDKEG